MDQGLLRKSFDKMNLEYRALRQNKQIITGSHFKHIAGNILQGMVGVSHASKFDWEKYRKPFLENWQQLQVYFGLIYEFEEFKKREFSSENGYFPLAPSRTHKEYICYAVQELRRR
jgi:hypothetical protein